MNDADLKPSDNQQIPNENLLELMPLGVFRLDRNGHCKYVNQNWCTMTGLSSDEALELGWLGIVNAPDMARVREATVQSKKNQRAVSLEIRVHPKFSGPNGPDLWVIASAQPIYSENKEHIGFLGTFLDITEKRADRLEHEVTNRRLLEAQSIAKIGSWEWNIQTGEISSSQEFKAIYEIAALNLSTQLEGLLKLSHPEDLERMIGVVRETRKTGGAFSEYHRIVTMTGKEKVLHSQGHVDCDPEGEAIRMYGTVQDVSEIRSVENLLVQSEAKFEDTFMNAPVGVSVISLNGDCLQVNPALTRILGYSSAELLKMNIRDLMLEDAKFFTPAKNDSPEDWQKQILSHEKCYRHKDGRNVWVHIDSSVISDTAGVAQYFIAHTLDITERKRIEGELEENRSLFKTIFEYSALGIALARIDGQLIQVNMALAQMLGYSADELVGKTYSDITYFEDKDIGPAEMLEAVAGKSDTLHLEKRYLHKNGSPVWMAMDGAVIRQPGEGFLLSTFTDISNLKKQERALLDWNTELEARVVARTQEFSGLAESVPQLIWSANSDGSPRYFNQKWIEYSGVTVHSETSWSDIIHEEDRPAAMALWQECLKSGAPYELEYRIRRASDGAFRWHISRACAISDAEGKPNKWFGTSTDIHDQREVLKTAFKNRAKFDAIIENANIVVWGADLNGLVTYSEGGGLAQAGVKSGDRVGLSIFELYKAQPLAIDAFRNAMAGEKQQLQINAANQWFEATVNPSRDENGVIKGIVGASINITEKVLADQAHREAQSRLETVLNHAPVILWSADAQGRFILLQGQGLGVADLKTENLVGTSALDFHNESVQGAAQVQKALHGDSVEFEAQYGGVPFHAQIFPVRDETGEVSGIVGFAMDLTERKKLIEEQSKVLVEQKANQELTAATEAKSQFLANMSHEIRTPLNGVLGMTGLLLSSTLTDEQRDFAETIKNSGDLLLALINDILDFSKIEAGKLDLEVILFDLDQMLKEIETTLVFSARKKGLKLFRSVAPTLPSNFYHGDPTRLRQVITNLVSNAIKFTHSGQVTLEVDFVEMRDGKAILKFDVTDTGIGIANELVPRMFKAFSQVDASTSRKFGGTGLGLSISKNLVHLLGGEIGVTSVENKGSVFWFTVAMEIGTGVANMATAENSAATSTPLKPLRILLAEDNPVNQMIAVKMLKMAGHYVDVVANGLEAVHALASIPYDLVLMDCQMPEMDGYEATLEIRRDQRASYHSIPIIAMTANAMNGDREKCLQVGMTEYVTKPISIKALNEIIAKVMTVEVKAA